MRLLQHRYNFLVEHTDCAGLSESLTKMTSASLSEGGSSAPNVSIQDFRGKLAQETFLKILLMLRKQGLHRKSPKLFIMYAHDNKHAKFEAHQEIVKKYITWFEKLLFNVDSDRTPHGYGLLHQSAHQGASTNIVNNQICLLPTSWHKKNVDYVLVFYSKLLASYMKDEREFFKDCDATYSKAIFNTCKKYENKLPVSMDDVCKDIRTVQEEYSKKMGGRFHHVLTETALLSFRNQNPGTDYTIPIILSSNEDWEQGLEWEPKYVHTTGTQIRITIESEKEYQQFFKILLMFESLESYRRPIEEMRKCFDKCLKLLNGDVQPEEYRSQREINISEALQNLNDQWPMTETQITPGRIRDHLNKYSKEDVKSIRRVSGDILPDSLDDIELVVAERRVSGQILPDNLDDTDPAVVEHLRSGGEGPGDEHHEDRQIVPLHGLFDERNVGGENVRSQRILIQGRPGIGKTTLCRRLMYEYSWHQNLSKKFDLVVRIPVWKLEYSGDLNNLLLEEYFQAVSEGQDMSNKLADLILDHENVNLENNASSVNILIILDGLNEYRRWSQERRALLEKLMQRPAVIITSRSYDTEMLPVSIDLLLEALGLSRTNVDAYLGNTEIVPSDTATEIHQFIKSKPFVKDMVRVPINLDILCYSWHEFFGHNTPIKSTTEEVEDDSPTMTALYQAVVRSLWRKDIPTLGKLDHGELMTLEVINAVRDSTRLERLIHDESTILEEIALNMMESHRLEFTDEDVAEAIQRLELNGKQLPLSLEINLHKLSILHSYSSERHRRYSFVHPTFQEFFAARYLARLLAHNRASLEIFTRKHKYNRRYEIVWTFFTGLLSKVEELDFFFNLLEDEPQDVVGIQHIQLFMYCLSECQIRIRPSRWDEYQRRLEDWLGLEFRVHKHYCIGSSMAFPENILGEQRLLEVESNSLRSRVMDLTRTAIRRESISESLLEYINRLIANNGDKGAIRAAASSNLQFVSPEFCKTIDVSTMWILKQRANLPADTISFFMEQIKQKTTLEKDLVLVLRRQRHLPDTKIKELVEWIKVPQLSRYADQILSNQVYLPKETIDSAIENILEQRSSASLAHWDLWYKNSVCLRHDLHAEAIDKVWDFLENATSRGDEIPDRILLDLSRIHLLQPEDIERLGNFLESRLRYIYPESMTLADEALEQQASLATDVLKIFVRLFRDEHSELFRAARHIVHKQPALSDEIVNKLRALLEDDEDKVVAVLQERLQLPDKAFKWLETHITKEKDANIKYDEAINYLLSQSDLPNYLVNSMPELTEMGIDFMLVAEILRQQKKLSDEVVNRLVELCPSGNYSLLTELIRKHGSGDPLTKTLEETRSETEVRDTASVLRHTNLHQESVQRLRSLLITEFTTELAALKSRTAFNCLLFQVKLDRDIILDLHDIIRKKSTRNEESQVDLQRLWKSRHIEQFCTNLAWFDSEMISYILRVFLLRPVEDLAPAYIHGKTLYFYAADGELMEEKLEDEAAFRERFREAQGRVGIPEWAWIKQPQEREEQNPSPAS